MTRYRTLGLWLFLSRFLLGPFILCSAACSSSTTHVDTPTPPGTLQGPLSLQITSSKESSLLFNTAAFAELLDAPTRNELNSREFELGAEGARQHLVVHVRDVGRGTGAVQFFCELEVFLYSDWPGTLKFDRNKGQSDDGRLAGKPPLLHESFRIEDRRRDRASDGPELEQGARHCAEQLAVEITKLRESAPMLVESPVAPAGVEPKAASGFIPTVSKPGDTVPAAFEIIHRLEAVPGNLTVTPTGRLIVSLHQFFQPHFPVAEIDAHGKLSEFASAANLDSVLGVQSDENGVVWLLDNGMKSTHKARLVAYHSVREKVVADIDLTAVMPKDAFFNDLVIDLDHEVAYLADPAGGTNAALVVVDLKTGKARRLLEGHHSVVPEDIELLVDGEPLEMREQDGKVVRPRVGLNPIAADASNEWLYFGPMHGSSLYRIKTASLRDASVHADKLAQAVERFSEKPITDGISIDKKGNLYLGDLAGNGIARISPFGELSTIASDPELSWVDAFSFGPDGYLYAVVNQLRRSAPLHRGKDVTKPPFLIIKIRTEVGGTVGR